IAFGLAAELDPERSEQDIVDVASASVGRLVVQRLPPLVQGLKLLGVLRERPGARPHALPRLVDLDVEENRQRMFTECLPNRRRLDRTAAERDHGGSPPPPPLRPHALL